MDIEIPCHHFKLATAHTHTHSWELTGLSELLLVVVQSFIVVHADSVHTDPQPLRDWLLAGGRKGRGKAQEEEGQRTGHYVSQVTQSY